jgi:hypothetical protein
VEGFDIWPKSDGLEGCPNTDCCAVVVVGWPNTLGFSWVKVAGWPNAGVPKDTEGAPSADGFPKAETPVSAVGCPNVLFPASVDGLPNAVDWAPTGLNACWLNLDG